MHAQFHPFSSSSSRMQSYGTHGKSKQAKHLRIARTVRRVRLNSCTALFLFYQYACFVLLLACLVCPEHCPCCFPSSDCCCFSSSRASTCCSSSCTSNNSSFCSRLVTAAFPVTPLPRPAVPSTSSLGTVTFRLSMQACVLISCLHM